MKVRTNYVSNSSTSSFIVVGIVMDTDDVKECFDDFSDEKDCYDFLWGKIEGTDLEIEHGLSNYCEDDYIVGKSIMLMKDEQTLGEFKKEVFDTLKSCGWKGDSKIEIIKDAGYDG